MKKQSNLSRLMGYARGHKILTYLSWVLSVMSALLALVPFWYIWRIIHDILEVSPDFSKVGNVTSYGWSAVLFAVISIVVYIAALMCSHLSAFRVAANIRKELMRTHQSGYVDNNRDNRKQYGRPTVACDIPRL